MALKVGTTEVVKIYQGSVEIEKIAIGGGDIPITPTSGQPNNEIWYTTSNDSIAVPTAEGIDVFGANLVNNAYTDKGVMSFDGNVTKIGVSAFTDVTTFTSISLPATVSNVDNTAFNGNCLFPIDNGIRYADKYATAPAALSMGEYNFKEGTRWIGTTDNFFANNPILTAITFPMSLEYIKTNCFSGCTALSAVTIPSTSTRLLARVFANCDSLVSVNSNANYYGDYAFSNCTSLSAVTLPDEFEFISGLAFINCPSLPEIDNIRYADYFATEVVDRTATSITIKEGTRALGSGSFSGCTKITSIDIPSSVTYIGSNAFKGCTRLVSLDIPEGVTVLKSNFASGCTALTSVTIPTTVTEIAASSFRATNNLLSINIPVACISIGNYCFYCANTYYGISDINYSGTQAQWAEITLGNNWKRTGKTVTVHCSDGDISV